MITPRRVATYVTEGVKLAFSAVTDKVSTARVELTCKPR
jgi:hypothetical protein